MTKRFEWWLTIPGWAPYEGSDRGRIRNGKTGRVLTTWPSKKTGHLRVSLSRNGRQKTFSVHRLILLTFVGPSDLNGLHRDDDPTNNHIENLYWGTLSQNVLDSVRNGTHQGARKTRCRFGHELSGDNLAIRRSGKRACRKCACRHSATQRAKGST